MTCDWFHISLHKITPILYFDKPNEITLGVWRKGLKKLFLSTRRRITLITKSSSCLPSALPDNFPFTQMRHCCVQWVMTQSLKVNFNFADPPILICLHSAYLCTQNMYKREVSKSNLSFWSEIGSRNVDTNCFSVLQFELKKKMSTWEFDHESKEKTDKVLLHCYWNEVYK